jgi:hypothetical protein
MRAINVAADFSYDKILPILTEIPHQNPSRIKTREIAPKPV